MQTFVSKSVQDTREFAHKFANSRNSLEDAHQGEGALVVGLYGELGAGKTTFMKYLAEALGVKETIQSPTFIIMKKFQIPNSKFKKLIHMDAYRLESAGELLKLGWRELLSDSRNLICVEWPERVASIMPSHFVLKFEHGEVENERKIGVA